jgi:fatty-acyl-CoA synthase
MTDTKVSIFDQDLPQTPANHAPISPLSFIERTAEVYPTRLAIVHGDLRQDWATTYRRSRQLASALTQAGIGKNDTVAVMLPNTPPMVEAHFGIPMAGAVLNALNTRLDPETVAFMLDHGEAKAVIVDPEFAGVMKKALALRQSTRPMLVIDVEDALYSGATEKLGTLTYEAFVASGDANFAWSLPANEWDAIAVSYTSGTTGNPKGLFTHHRGAATSMRFAMLEPGRCRISTVTCGRCPCSIATAGASRGRWPCWAAPTCACARWKRRPSSGVARPRRHHYCAAPIVHGLLVHAPAAMKAGVACGHARPWWPVLRLLPR